MNTTNSVKTFQVQIFSNVDHNVVLHTEIHTCTADQQRETIDALEARLRWTDHHWAITSIPTIDITTPVIRFAYRR